MNDVWRYVRRHWVSVLFWSGAVLAVTAGLAAARGHADFMADHYLVFHGVVEVVSVVVAFCLFIVTWNTRRFLQNGYLLFTGVAFFFIGAIHLLHMLAYDKMHVFVGYFERDLATQLWIVARYLMAITMVVAPLVMNRRLKEWVIFAIFALVVTGATISVFGIPTADGRHLLKVFPTCFSAETGLTRFKNISEGVICGLFVVAVVLLWRQRRSFDRGVLMMLSLGLLAAIPADIAFMLYKTNVRDTWNQMGHLLTLLSMFLIYKALIETGLRKPYDLLFRNIKRSEEAFRTLADHTYDWEYWVRPNGQYVYLSPSCERLTGYTAAEFQNDPGLLERIAHPDDRARVAHHIGGDLSHLPDVCEEEFRIITRQGQQRWIAHVCRAVHDAQGRPAGRRASNRDITEAKLAMQDLQRSRSELARMLESISDAFMALGHDWKFTYVNKTAARLLGQSVERMMGRSIWELFPEAVGSRFHREYEQAMQTGQPTHFEEYYQPFGAWYEVHAYPSPSRDSLSIFFADVTQRKLAEQALRESAEELARSNAELEQFAYIASHDLQEPLRMVSGYLQLLKRRYQSKLDADADEFIEYAVDGAVRMQALISDLLSYSRAGRKRREPTLVDMNVIAREVLQNLHSAIAESGGVVSVDSLPTVSGDASQLRQLLQNLLSNALKFRSADRPVKVHVSAEQTNGKVAFAVRDNGIGIEPQYFERVFAIFQRLHERDRYPGTGIGLAICKKIVEGHGGRIWIESNFGQGTTFHFILPADGSETEAGRNG